MIINVMFLDAKEVVFHESSGGLDCMYNHDLNDITIKIRNYKYIDNDFQKSLLNEPIIEIKSKGLHKTLITNIDDELFKKYYFSIENLNFDKLYSENYNNFSDDGYEFDLEINKKHGNSRYNKKIELWTPYYNKENPEINKLLKIYEEIRILANYEEYYKIIEQKRKLFKKKYNDE